jgi:hypothetical protein
MKVGDRVLYDDEKCIIVQIFPQQNPSPSGDVLLRNNDGVEFLVHHTEIE